MDKKHDFTLCGSKKSRSFDGECLLYRHEKSGFEVFHVKNKDPEAFFSYVVYTPPFDDSGVFHIIEHTVLSGSRKYRLKDPFTELLKSGCSTFANAMTGVDRTYYLASSPVKKDFLNFFDVYTDAVFNPLLRKEAFMSEACHVAEKDGEFSFEGVVYSEMLGSATQHESVISTSSQRSLFPDTAYSYESGGDPVAITHLKWEEYKKTYAKYYSPSNMHLFLWGDFETDEILCRLESYLTDAEPGDEIERYVNLPPFDAPRKVHSSSMLAEGLDEEKCSILLSWRLNPSSDAVYGMMLSILVDILLGSPGCPLYMRIKESDIGEDLSSESGMSSDFSHYTFSCGFSGAREEDEIKAEAFILSALEEIADTPLGEMQVEAALRRYEFSLKEIPGGIPDGMRALFKIDRAFAYNKNVFDYTEPFDDFEKIRAEYRKNPLLFNEFIKKEILNNSTRVLSVVKMSKDAEADLESKLARSLEEESALYCREDEELLEAYKREEDDDEALSSFPTLSSFDVKEKEFEKNPGKEKDSLTLVTLHTAGVIYFDLAVDVSDFSDRQKQYLNIYSRLLTMCSLPEMPLEEVSTKIRFLTGSFAPYVDSASDIEKKEDKCYFMLRAKFLSNTVEEGAAFIARLLLEGNIKENEVRNAVTDIKTDFLSGVIQNAHTYAMSLAESHLSASLHNAEIISGITFWKDISCIENYSVLSEEIRMIRNLIENRERFHLQVCCEKEDEEICLIAASSFLSHFSSSGWKRKNKDGFKPYYSHETYLIPSPVAFLSSAFSPDFDSLRQKNAARFFLSVLSSTALWTYIRAKGGAYGAGAFMDIAENAVVYYSYRDPRIDESFSDFIEATKAFDMTLSELDGAKIQARSRDLKPLSPAQKAQIYLSRRLYGITDSYRKMNRKAMEEVTLLDIRKAKDAILSALPYAEKAILSSSSLLKEKSQAGEYKTLPF